MSVCSPIMGEHILTKYIMEQFLTEKQQAVLDFIEEYQLNHGKSPTLREMREFFQVKSDNSILKHIKALEEKGFIEKDDTPRGIKLLQSIQEKLVSAVESFNLPVFGTIPAGGPAAAQEYELDTINLSKDFVKNGSDFFLLRVSGVSMINAGIFEGDLVVVDAKRGAKEGDVVVALVDNGSTLKRLMKKDGKFYLQAENPDYEDIHPLGELEVQGVVVSLIRRYH